MTRESYRKNNDGVSFANSENTIYLFGFSKIIVFHPNGTTRSLGKYRKECKILNVPMFERLMK